MYLQLGFASIFSVSVIEILLPVQDLLVFLTIIYESRERDIKALVLYVADHIY